MRGQPVGGWLQGRLDLRAQRRPRRQANPFPHPTLGVRLSGSCTVPHTQLYWCRSELLEPLGLGEEVKRAVELRSKFRARHDGHTQSRCLVC